MLKWHTCAHRIVCVWPSQPRTIFFISCVSGYEIKSFSLFPAQDEVLLPSGLKLLVTGKCEAGGGLTIITLQESAASPDSILHYSLPELPKPMQLNAPKPIVCSHGLELPWTPVVHLRRVSKGTSVRVALRTADAPH